MIWRILSIACPRVRVAPIVRNAAFASSAIGANISRATVATANDTHLGEQEAGHV